MLDVKGMFTNMNHIKDIEAVRDVMGNGGNYNPVIEPLELSVKSNNIMSNGEWFIQRSRLSTCLSFGFTLHRY